MRTILTLVALLVSSASVSAASFQECCSSGFDKPAKMVFYDATKVHDWKYHAYICKAVVMSLSVISKLQDKYGKSGITEQEELLKKQIRAQVLKEKKYPFDQVDADFIADLVFAAREGLDVGGFPLTAAVAQNQGFDICVSTLDKFDNELTK